MTEFQGGANWYTSPDTSTTAKVAAPPSILSEFEFALDDLHGVISELGIRLQPVLRPLGPELGQPEDPMPPVSAIRDKLNSLSYASGEVRRLLDRLDVQVVECPRPDKVRYPSRRDARYRARTAHKSERLVAYRCVCGCFHVGRLSPFTVAGYSLDRGNRRQGVVV